MEKLQVELKEVKKKYKTALKRIQYEEIHELKQNLPPHHAINYPHGFC